MQRLNASDAGFADAFDALVNGRREADADVSSVVTQTIRDVRARGDVTLAEGVEMVMPGDTATFTVKLVAPVALEEKQRFAIREGGKTVGAGAVTKIIA